MASETSSSNSLEGTAVESKSSNSFFDKKGAVAGVFTVVGLVAVALIALLIFFLCRRHRDDGKEINNGPASGKGSPSSFTEARPAFNMIQTPGAGGIMTAGPVASGSGMYNEKSYESSQIVPIEVDQRLDPGKVYMRWDHNDSRRSLQDDHDYSRKVLRVTNPDGR